MSLGFLHVFGYFVGAQQLRQFESCICMYGCSDMTDDMYEDINQGQVCIL